MTNRKQDIVVPALTAEQQQVYIRANIISPSNEPDASHDIYDERELAGKPHTIREALKGVNALVEDLKSQLEGLSAQRMAVEVGLEFALESGHLVAIVGKASGKSSIKVTLEWSNARTDYGASGNV